MNPGYEALERHVRAFGNGQESYDELWQNVEQKLECPREGKPILTTAPVAVPGTARRDLVPCLVLGLILLVVFVIGSAPE